MSEVFATGETYTWKDYQTVEVAGGNLTQPATLILAANTLPGQPQVLTGTFLTNLGLKGAKCTISPELTLNDNQSGTLKAVLVPTFGDTSGPQPCAQSAWNRYNGQSISIGGTRPVDSSGTPETEAQRTVGIQITSAQSEQNSPATLTVIFTNSSGAQSSVTLSLITGDGDPTQVAGSYSGKIELDPGTYTVTAAPVITQPATFTKVKYQSAAISLPSNGGDTFGTKQIAVTINIHELGGTTISHVDPVIVSLQQPAGTEVNSAQSDPIDINQAAVNQQQLDLGLSSPTNTNSTFTTNATLLNVDPGTYTICLIHTSSCQSVTKTAGNSQAVTFDVSGPDAAALLNPPLPPDDTGAPTCDVTAGSQLSWVLCPIINIGSSITDWILDNVIEPFLSNVPISADPSGPVYKIWSGFRIIANIMLVGVLLTVVIAQAVGKE